MVHIEVHVAHVWDPKTQFCLLLPSIRGAEDQVPEHPDLKAPHCVITPVISSEAHSD